MSTALREGRPGFSLGTAERLFRGGLTAQAEAACRMLLAADPGSVAATNLLAVILCRDGRLAEGEAVLRRALERTPDDPDLLRLLGETLHAGGQNAGAAEVFANLASRRPEDGETWRRLGFCLAALGRAEEALAAFDRAAALDPADARACLDRAPVLQALGRPDAALAACEAALARDPALAEAHFDRGNLLRDLGRFDEAALALAEAAVLRPGWPEAEFNLGLVRLELGDFAGARRSFARALSSRPGWAEAARSLAEVLVILGRPAEAADLCREMLSARSDDVPARLLLARACEAMGEAAGAARALDHPRVRESGLGRAALAALALVRGDEAAALDHARAGIDLAPGDPAVHLARAHLLLTLGRYREGFAEYEWRTRTGRRSVMPRHPAIPCWDGGDFRGRTLLLTAEQGLGDTIQFVRFLPRVKERGGRVILEVHPPLLPLLMGVAGADEVLALGSPPPRFDLHLPLLSLPHVLEVENEADLAIAEPYLFAAPDRTAKWRDRLGPPDGRLRVGVAWAGSRMHRNDRLRSMPAAAMLDALARPGVSLFSLQKEKEEGDAEVLAERAGRVTDLAPELSDFRDTAAAMMGLDLVAAADTAVVHAAGALGRPAWVLLPFVPDWRWQRGREDTPWYPGLRLFRQGRAGDWAAPLARAAAELDRLAGRG